MIEIVLSVCMIADPGKCKDVLLSFTSEQQHVTPQQCMAQGMPEIAKFMEGMPNWSIQRFKCQEGPGKYRKA